ncbi:MAG: hypothetical protein ACH37Z_14840 [Anaerolineae bacterium]|nr:hypothetical protein [Ardenticatenia bacterium]MBK8541508.1 hypothetical protein [Ardenticatenia bacterium]
MSDSNSNWRFLRRTAAIALLVGAGAGLGRATHGLQWRPMARDFAAQVVAAAPAQATPGDPPAVPTPAPDRVWRLRLRAFPDTVGKGAYLCPGCDGVFSGADAMGAASQPLEPLLVVILDPDDDARVLWSGRLKRSSGAQLDLVNNAQLTDPPPYEVRLVDTSPRGYTLCPNSTSGLYLQQADFDAAAGGAPDSGRSLSQDWFFWSCQTERP